MLDDRMLFGRGSAAALGWRGSLLRGRTVEGPTSRCSQLKQLSHMDLHQPFASLSRQQNISAHFHRRIWGQDQPGVLMSARVFSTIATAQLRTSDHAEMNNSSQRPSPPEQPGICIEEPASSSKDFCVVNFYHLVDLEQPFRVIKQHRAWLEGKDILGRIYITRQGINAQFSGPVEHAHAYADWVGNTPEFQGLRWASDPVTHHQFPRLRLKYRENLVQLAGGTTALPLSDPKARASPVHPAEWRQMLQQASSTQNSSTTQSAALASPSKPVVLDVRNSYEWDGGHFIGAQRPAESQFNQTPTEELPESLRDVPKDTPVMMYCTGGIRCDIYSPVLRQKGFTNLYTLHGGIANYLREMGSDQWRGSMFTFDNRLALAPDGKALSEKSLEAASPCKCCGGVAQLPHLNCANIDCNKLFLTCPSCQDELKGCCSLDCLNAPRMLRPRASKGHYGAWHTLVDESERVALTEAISSGRTRPTRLAKRQRRAERLKEKYEAIRQEKASRKALIMAAMEKMHQETEDNSRAVHEAAA